MHIHEKKTQRRATEQAYLQTETKVFKPTRQKGQGTCQSTHTRVPSLNLIWIHFHGGWGVFKSTCSPASEEGTQSEWFRFKQVGGRGAN